MSLSKAIHHNQSLFISAIISILCFGGLIACQLSQPQKEKMKAAALPIATAAATAAPTPWKEIALGIISLITSGTVVDNRRKDLLIKRLKTENANANAILTASIVKLRNNSARIPPVNSH